MEIQFATEELRDACLALVPKGEALPRAVLTALRDLYNEMRNAEHLDELVLGRPSPDDFVVGLDWSVYLADGHQAIVSVNHSKPPRQGDRIDLARVHRVRIMSIEVSGV